MNLGGPRFKKCTQITCSKPGRYPMLSKLNFRVGIKTKPQVIDPSFATLRLNLIIDRNN